MNRIRILIVVALSGLALLGIVAVVEAMTVTPGSTPVGVGATGLMSVRSDDGTGLCEEAAHGPSVKLPAQASAVEWPACSTVETVGTDFCGATPTAGLPLFLDGTGKVPSSTLPTGVVTGSGTDNYYPLWATGGTTLTIGSLLESGTVLRRKIAGVGSNSLSLYQFSTNPGYYPQIAFVRSDSGTIDNIVTTVDGDFLGGFSVYGVTSANAYQFAGWMQFKQDGASGSGAVPAMWKLNVSNGTGWPNTIECRANQQCTFVGNIVAANIVEAAAASATPKAGTDAKIAISWLPTGTATNQLVTGADARLQGPAAIACPSGSTCAGKTDSSTSTSTGTGTGTFYATATVPVSQTVTATWTAAAASSTVTSTLAVKRTAELNGIVTATATATASDVGAVATNTAITGATKTKITYDAKGLVTGGTDATPADIGALAADGATGTGNTVTASQGKVTSISSVAYVTHNSSGHGGRIPLFNGDADLTASACYQVSGGILCDGLGNFAGNVYSAGSQVLRSPSSSCTSGQVLTSTSAGNTECVTNGTGTGIGCSGTCSSPTVAMFSDATHVTNAPMSFSGNNATVTGTIAAANITSAPGATKVPVSDGSGTLNSWVTGASGTGNTVTVSGGRVTTVSTSYAEFVTDGTTGPGSTVATSVANTPVTVLSRAFNWYTGPANLYLTITGVATVNAASCATCTCSLSLYVDSTQVGVTGDIVTGTTNAWKQIATANGKIGLTQGSHTVYLYLTSDSGSYYCQVAANKASLTITALPN